MKYDSLIKHLVAAGRYEEAEKVLASNLKNELELLDKTMKASMRYVKDPYSVWGVMRDTVRALNSALIAGLHENKDDPTAKTRFAKASDVAFRLQEELSKLAHHIESERKSARRREMGLR